MFVQHLKLVKQSSSTTKACIPPSETLNIASLRIRKKRNRRKRLRKNRSSKRAMSCRIKHRIDYIKVKRKKYFLSEDWFSTLLAKTFHGFNERKISIKPNYVLGHGDIAPQNVIMHDAKLVLIDWEDLGLIDAGIEIAIIFDSFDFSEEQKEKFLREYLNSRKDPTIRSRIRVLADSTLWCFLLGSHARV
jgi:thiamine kinase-like enzyme